MASQLESPQFLVQRLAGVAIAITFIIFAILLGMHLHQISDPYVQEVLSLKGDRARGGEIFRINCAGCHSLQGKGSVGPSLHEVPKHRSQVSLIYQVIDGKTPPMPKFQPSSQEMADLLSYLETF